MMTATTLESNVTTSPSKALKAFHVSVDYKTDIGTPKHADLNIEASSAEDAEKQARNLIVHNGQRRCEIITNIEVHQVRKARSMSSNRTRTKDGLNETKESSLFSPWTIGAAAIAAIAAAGVGVKNFFSEPAQ
jgi:hypothetical protein